MEGRVVGLEALGKWLTKFDKKLDKPKDFYQSAALNMRKDIDRHFIDEMSPRGKWKALKFREGKILQDTGALKSSIESSYSNNNAMAGTNKVYAKVHNYGYPKRNIPERQFAWLSSTAYSNIINELMIFLRKD